MSNLFENVLVIKHDKQIPYGQLEDKIKEGIASNIGISVEEIRFKEKVGWSNISFVFDGNYNKTTSFSVTNNEILVTGELSWETVNVYNIICNIINNL